MSHQRSPQNGNIMSYHDSIFYDVISTIIPVNIIFPGENTLKFDLASIIYGLKQQSNSSFSVIM